LSWELACEPLVRSAAVVAEGECLVLAAALLEGPKPPSRVVDAALLVFKSASLEPLSSLSAREAAQALALAMGGMVAVSTCPRGPPTPIARVYRRGLTVPLGLTERGDRRVIEVLTQAARGQDPWPRWEGGRSELAPLGLECLPPYLRG
jgi:hypothetical protein